MLERPIPVEGGHLHLQGDHLRMVIGICKDMEMVLCIFILYFLKSFRFALEKPLEKLLASNF